MANGERGKAGAHGTGGGGTGGAGGRGGMGATGATGTTGSTGERGQTGKAGQPGVGFRAAVVGYLILLGFVFFGFHRIENTADEAKRATERALAADAALEGVVADNRDLLCNVGELVSDQPIARQRGETIPRYVERLDDYRGFLKRLRDKDCKGIVKEFPPKEAERQARKILREERRLGGPPNGGGGRQQGNPPSQQPAPGNGGSGGDSGGGNPPPAPPPNNPPPPREPGLLDPVCDTVDVLGVQLC